MGKILAFDIFTLEWQINGGVLVKGWAGNFADI